MEQKQEKTLRLSQKKVVSLCQEDLEGLIEALKIPLTGGYRRALEKISERIIYAHNNMPEAKKRREEVVNYLVTYGDANHIPLDVINTIIKFIP